VPVDSVAKRITLVHVRPEITHCVLSGLVLYAGASEGD
jgi:hypothetical protein